MQINKYSVSLCGILFNIYLLVFWFMPLIATDGRPNEWVNVLIIHLIFIAAAAVVFLMAWLMEKSKS